MRFLLSNLICTIVHIKTYLITPFKRINCDYHYCIEVFQMIEIFRKRVDIYSIIILLKILFKQNVLYKTLFIELVHD